MKTGTARRAQDVLSTPRLPHDVRSRATAAVGPMLLPLLSHSDRTAAVAFRDDRPLRVDAFLADVAALAARLPARAHVVNLCVDRYRFAVGFAAALVRGQVNLLPPGAAPELLRELADQLSGPVRPDRRAGARLPSGDSGDRARGRAAGAQARDACLRQRAAGGDCVHFGFDREACAAPEALGRARARCAGRGPCHGARRYGRSDRGRHSAGAAHVRAGIDGDAGAAQRLRPAGAAPVLPRRHPQGARAGAGRPRAGHHAGASARAARGRTDSCRPCG